MLNIFVVVEKINIYLVAATFYNFNYSVDKIFGR